MKWKKQLLQIINSASLTIKDFIFQMNLFPYHFITHFYQKWTNLNKKGQRIEKYFWEEKEHLISLEKEALKNHPRLYLYHQILMSVPKLFNMSQKHDFTREIKKLFKRNKKDIILEGGWVMK